MLHPHLGFDTDATPIAVPWNEKKKIGARTKMIIITGGREIHTIRPLLASHIFFGFCC
jgi:hypothetical protein